MACRGHGEEQILRALREASIDSTCVRPERAHPEAPRAATEAAASCSAVSAAPATQQALARVLIDQIQDAHTARRASAHS